MIYFTADQHLNHRNIIEYCKRPFKNTHHMNTVILENYVSVIRPEDVVYFLGDITMVGSNDFYKIGTQLEALPGTKHLILGNHDKLKPFEYLEHGFSSVHTGLELLLNANQVIYLTHDPARAQKPNTTWFCGHIHNLWRVMRSERTNTKIINVGVDIWDFKPVSLETLKELL